MDLELAHRVVFVTGGSRGIGQAAAARFAREGARVAFSYHTGSARADETVAAVKAEGGEALPVWLDLADPDSMAQAVATVRERWGGIDVFVANAVRWPSNVPDFQQRFEDMPREEWRALLEGTLGGTIASVQAVLPAMRGRQDGRIVLVSSDVARHGFQGSGGYGSAKAGLSGLASALVAELGGDILVNTVTPGFTVTERNLEVMPQHLRDGQAARTPTRRLSTPDEVARAIVFLGSPANGNITGDALNVTGGL